MSKSSSRSPKKRHAQTHVSGATGRRARDRAIYIGLTMIGAFAVFLVWLLTGGEWRLPVLIYLLGIAWFVNVYTFKVYRGAHLAHWQAALARLPLRCVGYGTRGGKPIEAAHDQPEVLRILTASIVFSVVVLAVLAVLLVPQLQPW